MGQPFPLGFSRPFAFRKGARKMSTSAQLAGNHAGLLNGEERTQLESLRNSYVYALNPTNIVEVALFDLLVLTAWKIERTNRLEAVAKPTPNRKFSGTNPNSSPTPAKLTPTPPSKPVEMNLVPANQAENTRFAVCGTRPIQPLGSLRSPNSRSHILSNRT